MRTFHRFLCEGDELAGTLDDGNQSTGLLIVGGGNEIRSGAHAGMARLAQFVADNGFPVFRYDRRGIGDSGGINREFLSTEADLMTASDHFQFLCSTIQKTAVFGNCDAATALALFENSVAVDALILANPWVIESETSDISEPVTPPPSTIRARYWQRLKNPQTIIDVFKGRIDFKKLLKGLKQATKIQDNSGLALRLRDALMRIDIPVRILLAERDTTAQAFLAAWKSADYDAVRNKSNIEIVTIDSASHSFADDDSKIWLEAQILKSLQSV